MNTFAVSSVFPCSDRTRPVSTAAPCASAVWAPVKSIAMKSNALTATLWRLKLVIADTLLNGVDNGRGLAAGGSAARPGRPNDYMEWHDFGARHRRPQDPKV